MDNYQTLWLPEDFKFRLDHTQAKLLLSDVDQKAIDDIWEREQAKHSNKLFNGKVLNLISQDREGLTAGFIEYKHLIAYLHEPRLRGVLNIRPLSLSCLTHTDRAVLIGKRSQWVSQYPLWYELAPSGGIDPEVVKGADIDVVAQALSELDEETGLSEKDVISAKPFALIHELDSGIIEVCIELVIRSEKEKIALTPTPEYDELHWISYSDLLKFIESHANRIVPLSLHLLRLNEQRPA